MTDELGNGNSFVKISNKEIYQGLMDLKDEVHNMKVLLTTVLEENIDLKKRVRLLELKSYGILAGLIGAIVVMFRIGGVPV